MELTAEQVRIVDTKPNGHILIKGVAGSGKTTVAVQKIPNLINHYMENEDDKILLITYNKTLIQYINYICKNMNLEEELFFHEDIKNKVEICTVDKIIWKLHNSLPSVIKNRTVRDIITPNKRRELFLEAIHYIEGRRTSETIVVRQNIDFLMDEIDWMKSCKYNDRETYLYIDRIGRMSGKEENSRFALQKNSVHRNEIFDLFEIYERLLIKYGYNDFKSMALVVLNAMNKGRISYDRYPHIIIDESQDLTRVQFEIISKMYQGNCPYASITFIADTAQSIYEHSWLANHSFKSIGYDMSGRAKILSKNHRTTVEIAKAAYSLIEKDEEVTKNENYVQPETIEKHGDIPVYKHFQTNIQEFEYVEQLLKKRLCKYYELHDIAILARTKSQLINMQTYLASKNIASNLINKQEQIFDGEQIHLMTLHSIKGLEFPVIIIVGLNDGLLPYEKVRTSERSEFESIERKLLYVGMTRAKSKLFLSSYGKASKFVTEIDQKLICSGEHEFSMLRNIGIENYRFTDKLKERNSYEEMVRQWYLEELIVKLEYPLELLDIEYKVQAFSQIGFVDLVIFDFVNGGKVPIAFIEIKRKNEELTSAKLQLEQYISCYSSVCYGVVTNGDQMICIQKDNGSYKEIRQLPRYVNNTGNLYTKYEYISFIHKKEYSYRVNLEDKEEIIIKKKQDDFVLDSERMISLNIYGKVAAGGMQAVYENRIDSMQIPEEFLIDKENCFGLEVSGDSMIDAGIYSGDYVIVHKQGDAKRREIVIAIDRRMNEATMKRFDFVGNSVILSPENSKYNPIILPIEDVIINGVVIGVLRRGNF